MTNDELKVLLSFEEHLACVTIAVNREFDGGEFIIANLDYGDFTLTVPFVHYDGEDWLFTPRDWQQDFNEDMESIDWRVNNTEIRGIMYDGLPRLF